MTSPKSSRPVGIAAIGVFFCFGSIMAAYAAFTLFHPGTVLDRLWALNRPAHMAVVPLGRVVAVPFLTLSVVMFLAAVGWFRREYWGWLLGTSVIAANLAADFIHALLGDWLRSGTGVLIAGLFLFYLTRPAIRTYFLPRLEAERADRLY